MLGNEETARTYQKDVNQEVSIASTLQEDTERWQDDGEAGTRDVRMQSILNSTG